MAGEWVKMRPSLLTHPKVVAMAAHLENDSCFELWLMPDREKDSAVTDVTKAALRYVTVGGLLAVWGCANEHTTGGFLPDIGVHGIDDIAGIDGFGRAMSAVGWAVISTDPVGVSLPHFSTYNTTAKDRPKSGAERQRRYRARQQAKMASDESDESDVTRVTLEKRREEKSKKETPPTPPRGGGE